jgi:2-(1,2-epoxy-1,2-dihydrophenyl)acetyl-CoA isomerase
LETSPDGVRTLTLNRPGRLNALTVPLMRELAAALARAAADPDIRVVVLAGAGKAFCAGGDTRDGRRDAAAGDRPKTDPAWKLAEQRYERLRPVVEASVLLHEMPKPTVAVMRGAAIGAGLSLALACDFRVASDSTIVRTGFASIGYSGDYGGSYFLSKVVGPAKARELYLLNEKLEASQANQIGMFTRLCPDDQLDSIASDFVRRLADGPPVAYRYMKQNLNAAERMSATELLDLETRNMVRTSETQDAAEAARAMLDKRAAVFKGY